MQYRGTRERERETSARASVSQHFKTNFQSSNGNSGGVRTRKYDSSLLLSIVRSNSAPESSTQGWCVLMTDASGEPGLVRGGSLFRFLGQGPPNHPRAMNPPPPAWNAHAHAHTHAHASHFQTQQGQPRSQARVSAGLSAGPSAGPSAGLYTPPAGQSVHHATPQRKTSLPGALPSPVTLQGTQEWFERSAVASEKGKAIFGAVNRVFQSSDWGLSDVQRLLSIHLEQPVRSLDRLAAHQALKAAAVQERQWSTEPNGQGFRMTGREAKGYIDRNNIDPTRLLFSASDEGIPESRLAQSIGEESSSELQKAALLRQASPCARPPASTWWCPAVR